MKIFKRLTSFIANWFNPFKKTEQISLFTQPKLEDGEIITLDDGIYQRCPQCNALVPKLVKVVFPDAMMEENPCLAKYYSDPDELHDLWDPRHMITGQVSLDGSKAKRHCQCIVCGMPLRDKDGNILFLD